MPRSKSTVLPLAKTCAEEIQQRQILSQSQAQQRLPILHILSSHFSFLALDRVSLHHPERTQTQQVCTGVHDTFSSLWLSSC